MVMTAEQEIMSVFYLPKNSGNSGRVVNGTRHFGSFHWKFSGINGIPEKVGRFPFTKKFGNFLLGIFVWENRVPFVTSPILGRPGRLIDRERHGTGDKTINL